MKTHLGSATTLKTISSIFIIFLLAGCENGGSPVRSDDIDISSVTFTDGGDPASISHIRTYFSISHQGIAVDDKYIYGIHAYFISVTEKESGKSTSHDFLYADNTYKDYTDEMNDFAQGDVELITLNASIGNAFYIGGFEKFSSILMNISQAGSGSWNCVWEYWNGDHWVGLSGISDGTNCFRNSGIRIVRYNFPGDWQKTSANGKEAYYIRSRVSAITSIFSDAVADWAFVGRYVRDDALPASGHYSDGVIETKNGVQYLFAIGPGDSDIDGKIVRYTIPELKFDGIEHSWDHGPGNFSGIDKHKIGGREYWWVIWDISDHNVSQNKITRYDLDWTGPVDYNLQYYNPNRYNYQGFTWWSNGSNDYIFANMHSPFGTTDIYKWNGRGFTALDRLTQVTSGGFEANQGFTWEKETGYLWAAARGNGVFSAFKCRVKSTNEGEPGTSIYFAN